MALLGIAILALNYPGQVVVDVDMFTDGQYGPHFDTLDHCEHGWPFTYLRRDWVMLGSAPYYRLSDWNIFEGIVRFSAIALVADAVLGCAIVLALGLLWEAWVHQRKRLLQFHIRDMFVLAAIVAACAAVYVSHRSRYRDEQNILRAIDESDDDPTASVPRDAHLGVQRQPGGPTWVRSLVGDWPFQVFDRVVRVDIGGEKEMEHVVRLSSLQAIGIYDEVSNCRLQLVEQLPELVALDMCWCQLVAEDGLVVESGREYIRLPRLPKLRGLNLCGTAFRGDGLENIPSIEMLDLEETDIDDESVPALAVLAKLKKLELYETAVTDAGVDRLRRALPNCEILK